MGKPTVGFGRRQCIKEIPSSDPARQACFGIVKDCTAAEGDGASTFVFELGGEAKATKGSLRECMKYAPDAAKAGYTLQGAKARPKPKAGPSKQRARKSQDDEVEEKRSPRPSRAKRRKNHATAETGLLEGAKLTAMIQKGSDEQKRFFAIFQTKGDSPVVVEFDVEGTDAEDVMVEPKGVAFRYEGGADVTELGRLSKADRKRAGRIILRYIKSVMMDVGQDMTEMMRSLMGILSGHPDNPSVEFSVRCSARDDFQTLDESTTTYLDPKRCRNMEMRIASDDFAIVEDMRLGWKIAGKGKYAQLLDTLGIGNDPKRCDSFMRVKGVDTVGIDNYNVSIESSDDDEPTRPSRRKRSRRKKKRSSSRSSSTKTFTRNGHQIKAETRDGVTRLWIDGERIKKSDPRYAKTLKRIERESERVDEELDQARDELDGAMEQMDEAMERMERRTKDLWDDEEDE